MVERLNPYDLGNTAVADELPGLLGYRASFSDSDKDVVGAKTMLSGLPIEAIWVKNDSSGTLAAADIVTWKDGYAGTRVGAKAGATVRGAGVVDPYVGSAGVADGKHFWLIVRGPADLKTDGTAITAGNQLMTGATGYAVPYSSGAAQAVSRCGVALQNATTVAGTKFRALVEFPY